MGPWSAARRVRLPRATHRQCAQGLVGAKARERAGCRRPPPALPAPSSLARSNQARMDPHPAEANHEQLRRPCFESPDVGFRSGGVVSRSVLVPPCQGAPMCDWPAPPVAHRSQQDPPLPGSRRCSAVPLAECLGSQVRGLLSAPGPRSAKGRGPQTRFPCHLRLAPAWLSPVPRQHALPPVSLLWSQTRVAGGRQRACIQPDERSRTARPPRLLLGAVH